MPHLEHLRAETIGSNRLSLAPLEHCKKLQSLRVEKISGDLTPLAELVELKNLYFHQGVPSLASLEQLVNLEQLSFGWEDVEDLSPLANMTKLRVLKVG